MSTVVIHVTNIKLLRMVLFVVMRQDCKAIMKMQIHTFSHFSFLAENYSSNSDVNIVVWSTDIDSLIIAVGCFQKLLEKHEKLKLWVEIGVKSKKCIAICQHESYMLIFGSVYFLLCYQFSMPSLAATTEQHSLEKIKFALSNV